MTMSFSTTLRDARNNAITTAHGASGFLRHYSGTRPANVGTALSGNTLLAELGLNATFAPGSSSGVLTLNSITQDSSADNTGTASFFRTFKSDGTTAVVDGNLGTSGADMNMNSTSYVAGGPVSVTSWTITDGNP